MNQSPATRRPLVAHMGVDVGYGHTKLAMDSMPDPSAAQTVTSAAQGIRSTPAHVTVFPSTVILSRSALAHGGVLGNHAHDCVHDGIAAYLYGDSAIDSDDGASARSLDAQFANSNEYSILLKACLQRRNYPITVARLVLGVPFDRMQSAATVLKRKRPAVPPIALRLSRAGSDGYG